MAKTILITGASTRIGYETAVLLQKKGWNVVATMRSLRDTRRGSPQKVAPDLHNVLYLDITDPDSI
jgi:NAD(P)-dependent dehydrogenase (short-subunit alcohol dehydrogenase family)